MQMTNAEGREQLPVMLIRRPKVALCGRVESVDGISSGTKHRRAAQGHSPILPVSHDVRYYDGRCLWARLRRRLSLETVGLCVLLSVIMKTYAGHKSTLSYILACSKTDIERSGSGILLWVWLVGKNGVVTMKENY